ncbi:hypothetical protein GCM10027592_48910 [Spirosoma flavus]
MIDIDWVKSCVNIQEYLYSAHADKERLADNLTLLEVEEAILNGIILEQYVDTGRGVSCLVAGFTTEGKPVHIVVGRRNSQAIIITVYIPTPPKFITPFKRNRP